MTLAVPFLVLWAQASALDSLERRHQEQTRSGRWNPEARRELLAIQRGVAELIAQDRLQSPNDWWRAAALLEDGALVFETARPRYELTVAAALRGDSLAKKAIPERWDALQYSACRSLRFGTITGLKGVDDPRFRVEAPPRVITDFWKNPDRRLPEKDNPEVQRLVDEDQRARQSDWSKLSEAQLIQIVREDRRREERLRAILRGARGFTANDFFNAALVLQHGSDWETYALAHESAVCASLLGHRTAPWLAAASYDRMLSNAGYRQRFGTQYGPDGLTLVDEAMINDRLRAVLGCPPLEEARRRRF